jgi:hypothetical protein
VTVNVNTGRVDSRRWLDASERVAVDTDASRWVQYPARTTERQVITREVPKTVRVAVPPPVVKPVVQQVVQQRRIQPVIMHAVAADPPLRPWKEFT